MSTSPEPGTPAPDPAATPPAPDPTASAPAPDPAASAPLPETAPPPPEPPPLPPATLEQLVPGARALVIGLGWGAVMLVLLGLWLRDKSASFKNVGIGILVAAGVAAGLAAWQAFTLWFQKEPDSQKAAALAMQRKLLGNFLLFAGLAFILLAFYIGIDKLPPSNNYGFNRENLAESIGVLLLGVIVLGGGYLLTSPVQTEDESPLRNLLGRTSMLKLGTLVLGVVSLVSFIAIAYNYRAGSAYVNWIPELGALLFMSLLCFTCVIWLNTGEFDEVSLRVFVLVFGGSVGGILFFYTLARAYAWRSDVFGGIAAWQGTNGWRFWLIVYVQIVALILMFVSFRLARADVRSSVTLRRVMYGYDAILQFLLVVEMLAILNVIVTAQALPNYDWSKTRGAYGLADSSRNLISGLKKEINVIVLMRQGNPIYKDLHNLLDNCEALNSTHFKVTYYTPESDPLRYESLAKAFPKLTPDGAFNAGVLIIDGKLPETEKHNLNYAFVPERKLSDVERPRGPGDKVKVVFKAEGEILKEVKFLVMGKEKRKIYILQGDEEADINNNDGRERNDFRETFRSVGVGFLMEKLETDGYETSGLTFNKEFGKLPPKVVLATGDGKKKSIPEDCQTLIIPGPSKKMSEETLEAIERYLDKGGKMIAFVDVVVDDEFTKLRESGLEEKLKRYGVDISDEFMLRIPRAQAPDARLVLATTPRNATNPVAAGFARRPIFMKWSARVVKPSERPGKYRADVILNAELNDDIEFYYVVEKKVSILRDPQRHILEMLAAKKHLEAIQEKPIPVAVAVTESASDKPQIVVFGDTEFITNLDLARSRTKETNYAFVVSCIEMLGGREEMAGQRPKETTSYILGPEVNADRMVFLPAWLMLLGISGMGIGVWIVRRR